MDIFSIQTRQKTDVLFPAPLETPITGTTTPEEPPADSAPPRILPPLKALSSVIQGPVRIDGYAVISVLAISDQPFEIVLSESISFIGPFSTSQTLTSSPSGASQVISVRFTPIGMYLKMVVENLSAVDQTLLSMAVKGIPLP